MTNFQPENPPPRTPPPGRRSRHLDVINACKANPGTWYRLDGEHYASTITTLKNHGLKVRSKKAEGQAHKHILWACLNPVAEPDKAGS